MLRCQRKKKKRRASLPTTTRKEGPERPLAKGDWVRRKGQLAQIVKVYGCGEDVYYAIKTVDGREIQTVAQHLSREDLASAAELYVRNHAHEVPSNDISVAQEEEEDKTRRRTVPMTREQYEKQRESSLFYFSCLKNICGI